MTIFALDKHSAARLIEPKKVYWFIEPDSPLTPLSFIRAGRGAFVIGGKTGSHLTGHVETWWDKLLLIGSLGYIPVELAIGGKLIPEDWAPPRPCEKDALAHSERRDLMSRGSI
jgi:hypothetical protein